jgi:antitoxin component YwqK of YwqJK toxin-antitoxin module
MKQFLIPAFLAILGLGQAFPQKVLDYRGTFQFPEGRDSVMPNKEVFTYTPEGWLESKAVYYYDSQLGQWVGSMYPVEECIICPGKYTNVYNEKGQKIQSTAYSWFGITRGWVRQIETYMDYDDQGNLAYVREGTYDYNSGDYSDVLGQEMMYDDSGNLNEKIWYRWDTGKLQWNLLGRETWEYDLSDSDTLILHTLQNWSYAENSWGSPRYQRIDKKYDTQGNLLLTAWSDLEGRTWRVNEKEERTYDPDGKLSQILLMDITGTDNWVERLRTTLTYDDSERLVYEERQGYMELTIGLRQKLKLGRYFDADGDVWQEVWYFWDYDSKTYQFGFKDYYFYRSLTGTQPILNIPEITVYPNPTSGRITITGIDEPLTLRLFNLQGQLLKTQYQVKETADLTGMPAGFYVLDLESGDGTRHRIRMGIY